MPKTMIVEKFEFNNLSLIIPRRWKNDFQIRLTTRRSFSLQYILYKKIALKKERPYATYYDC